MRVAANVVLVGREISCLAMFIGCLINLLQAIIASAAVYQLDYISIFTSHNLEFPCSCTPSSALE